MAEMGINKAMVPWWWDERLSPRPSQWLQSTLSELEEKRAAMLELIQEDGESFAPGHEFYDDRKQEVVRMVEDFYLSYRYLAENYYQLKPESMQLQNARSSSSASSNSMKSLPDLQSATKKNEVRDDDSKLEQPNSSPESVVEDPDTEFSNKAIDSLILVETDDQNLNLNETRIQNFEDLNIENGKEIDGYDSSSERFNSFLDKMTIGLQVSELLQECVVHQAELIRRNEEKREIIKDLNLQLHRAMEENKALQVMCTGCPKIVTKQNSVSHVSRLKGMFIGKIWRGGST